MSDSRQSGADSSAPRVTAESEGIAIEKTFAADEFDTPAIVLTIENGRSSPVSLRVIDPLPEELDQSDIGFHPEYAAEGWTRRDDGDLQIDRDLEAGESIKSVYGIRLSEVQDPARLLREPEIDEVVEIAEAEGTSAGDPASANDIEDAIPDAESEEATADAADDATELGADEETAHAASTNARTESGAPGRDRTRRKAGETVDSLATPTTDGETLAEALAAELERGSVDDDTLQTLNEHLSPRLAESSQVRLDNVQARLADLEAYTEALEGILDTVGTDEDITRTIGAVQDDLEKVAAQADALRDELDDTIEGLEETDADVEELSDDLEREIEDVQSEIESLSDDVDDRLDDLETDLEDSLEDVEAAMDEVHSELSDDLEDLREDIDDLVEWRDDFVGAVGAGGGDEE